MKICHFCGKGAMSGRSHRHRHSAWAQRAPKLFAGSPRTCRPPIFLPVAAPRETITACTKCLKAGKTLKVS